MESTRRAFLGAVSVAASASAMPEAAETLTSRPRGKFYVAAVTPCDNKGRFDEALCRDLMPYFKQGGCDGVMVLGTTGEFPSFSVAERKKIAETALKHRSGMEMLVQVGTPNLPETLDLLAHATANGATGVLCAPPFYFKNPSVEGLTKYFSHVLEAAKIPVYLYHYPAMSAVPISPQLLHNLEKYPSLGGIKDSTGNAESYTAMCKEFPKLDMMSGTENNLPIALQHGNGAMLVSGNLFPKQTAAVFAAHRAGKSIDEAYAKMRDVQGILRGTGASGAAGIKFALQAYGLRESFVRPPQVDMTAEQKAAAKPKLAELAKLA